jgi:hypothetical protein
MNATRPTNRPRPSRPKTNWDNRIPFTLSARSLMLEGVRLHVLPIASAQLFLVLPLTVAMAVVDAGASWLARRRHGRRRRT